MCEDQNNKPIFKQIGSTNIQGMTNHLLGLKRCLVQSRLLSIILNNRANFKQEQHKTNFSAYITWTTMVTTIYMVFKSKLIRPNSINTKSELLLENMNKCWINQTMN